MDNFADGNSLYVIARTVAELKNTLPCESEVVIDWFKNNKIIFNPEKFQATILDKQKHDHLNETIKFVIKRLRLCLLSGPEVVN